MSTVLFSIPDHWQQTTLGEVCRRGGGFIQTGPFGSQLHAADYVPVGVPSIMPVNIGENRIIPAGIACIPEADAKRLSKHRVQAGDIVYSRRGDVERRSLVRQNETGWLCGTGCLLVRLGKGVTNPIYASFYLGHAEVRKWIVRHAVGATMPNLNTGIMSAVPFVLPPSQEQDRIAEILGSLDDKIELNRRTNETLEAMARTLFRSWFVDFDPVRAKADGQKPQGMDAATAKLFPDSFEPSALGPIPKGWRVGVLSDMLTISRDGVNPLEHPNEAFDHYSIPAFDEGKRPKHEAGAAIKSNKYLVPASAVLLSKLNPRIPRVWFPNVSRDHRSVCSTEFLVCQAQPVFSREFLHSYLSSVEFTDDFASLVTGTSGSHQRVKPDDVLRLKTLVPDVRTVRAFGEMFQPLFLKAAVNVEESRILADTRDALLPKLLSGEVSVSADGPLAEVR